MIVEGHGFVDGTSVLKSLSSDPVYKSDENLLGILKLNPE